jgi:hypothetical protein
MTRSYIAINREEKIITLHHGKLAPKTIQLKLGLHIATIYRHLKRFHLEHSCETCKTRLLIRRGQTL